MSRYVQLHYEGTQSFELLGNLQKWSQSYCKQLISYGLPITTLLVTILKIIANCYCNLHKICDIIIVYIIIER